ncbi:MAG: hypothetical protein JWM55_966 [Acidimicrobiaceae bacterium]|nr:hypothetical protein [Acidimicrobiaceae bacterium]
MRRKVKFSYGDGITFIRRGSRRKSDRELGAGAGDVGGQGEFFGVSVELKSPPWLPGRLAKISARGRSLAHEEVEAPVSRLVVVAELITHRAHPVEDQCRRGALGYVEEQTALIEILTNHKRCAAQE